MASHGSMRVLFSLALLEIYNPYTVDLIDIHDACEQNYRSYSSYNKRVRLERKSIKQRFS